MDTFNISDYFLPVEGETPLDDVTEEVVGKLFDVGSDTLADFDPSNPNAEHSAAGGMIGDVVLNTITGGMVGTVFSDGAEVLGQFNDLTDNAFTLNNIENTVEDVVENLGDAIEDVFGF